MRFLAGYTTQAPAYWGRKRAELGDRMPFCKQRDLSRRTQARPMAGAVSPLRGSKGVIAGAHPAGAKNREGRPQPVLILRTLERLLAVGQAGFPSHAGKSAKRRLRNAGLTSPRSWQKIAAKRGCAKFSALAPGGKAAEPDPLDAIHKRWPVPDPPAPGSPGPKRRMPAHGALGSAAAR